jgi:uncharacterized protein (DUF4415 family)
MKKTVAKKAYTKADMRAVSDNPEWTKADFAKAVPFDELLPKLRKGRGPNKAPTKKQVTLRLSPVVLEHFKAKGKGWQSRIDEALVKIVKRKAG